MNELRRKLVLGTPLMTVGFFTGCGGGDAPSGLATADERLRAQAVAGTTGQTLNVSAVWPNVLVDDIWWNSGGGGFYFVPSVIPSVQAVINFNVLHVSLFEQVNPSPNVKIYKSLQLMLASPSSGAPLSENTIYPINGTTNTAQVRILKRTTESNGSITDTVYAYSPSGSGTVEITDITLSGGNSAYKLDFSSVRFQAASGSAAVKPLSIGGYTTLIPAMETADWV